MSHDKEGHGGGKKPYNFKLLRVRNNGQAHEVIGGEIVAWNFEQALNNFSTKNRNGEGNYILINMNTCTIRNVEFYKPEPSRTWKVIH